MPTLPQDKSFQVYSNELLEERRVDQRSSRNARSSDRHNQLRSIRLDSTRFILIQFNNRYKQMTPEAEKFNGWMAMIGFVAAVGAYATTGNIIPGIF